MEVLSKRTKKEVAAKMMGTKPKQKLMEAKTTAKAVLGKLAKPKPMQPKAPPVCQRCERPAAVDVKCACRRQAWLSESPWQGLQPRYPPSL